MFIWQLFKNSDKLLTLRQTLVYKAWLRKVFPLRMAGYPARATIFNLAPDCGIQTMRRRPVGFVHSA